jgi:hypothetical protein
LLLLDKKKTSWENFGIVFLKFDSFSFFLEWFFFFFFFPNFRYHKIERHRPQGRFQGLKKDNYLSWVWQSPITRIRSVISSWFLVANFHRILTSKIKRKYFVINDQIPCFRKKTFANFLRAKFVWFVVANFHRILMSKIKTKYFVINSMF